MKAAREKKSLTCEGKTEKVLSRSIHRNLAGQKGVAGYIRCAESEKYAAKNSIQQNRSRDKKGQKACVNKL